MRILEGLERGQPRGVYSGCLGWFSLAGGACDLAVVIRTAVVTRHGTSLGAGGAIVYQSSRDEEFEEMILKTKAVASAIAHVAGGGSSVRMVGCPTPYAPPISVIESS
jgi:para-aminobenzoate synthetase